MTPTPLFTLLSRAPRLTSPAVSWAGLALCLTVGVLAGLAGLKGGF